MHLEIFPSLRIDFLPVLYRQHVPTRLERLGGAEPDAHHHRLLRGLYGNVGGCLWVASLHPLLDSTGCKLRGTVTHRRLGTLRYPWSTTLGPGRANGRPPVCSSFSLSRSWSAPSSVSTALSPQVVTLRLSRYRADWAAEVYSGLGNHMWEVSAETLIRFRMVSRHIS